MKRSADVHKSDVSGERAGVAASAAVVAVELAVSDVSKRFRAGPPVAPSLDRCAGPLSHPRHRSGPMLQLGPAFRKWATLDFLSTARARES